MAQQLVPVDDVLVAVTEAMERETGRPILTADEAQYALIGIPVPCLSLAYLFGSNVIPMTRMLQIVGLEGSCKTAFLCEIVRWALYYGGLGILYENENKDSANLRASIFEHRADLIKRVRVPGSTSMDEWTRGMCQWTEQFHRHWTGATAKQGLDSAENLYRDEATLPPNKRRGTGWRVPIVYGVDSLMATATEATLEKIYKEGIGRSFPLEALMLAGYNRTLPRLLGGKPIIFLCTNHLKPGQDRQGKPTRNIPGGGSPRFFESAEIEMRRLADINLAGHGGIELRLSCQKSSLGPSRCWIQVAMIWRLVQEEGEEFPKQYTYFDWYSSTIDMLLRFEPQKTKWHDICDIVHLKRHSQRRVTCKQLGLNEPVSYYEAGRILESRTDLLQQLYPLLYITPRPAFVPGVDYRDQIAKVIKEARVTIDQRPYEMPDTAVSADIERVGDKLHAATEKKRARAREVAKLRIAEDVDDVVEVFEDEFADDDFTE